MSEQGLFRKKAMQAQANKLDGDVLIAQPVRSIVLTLCLVATVVVVVIFLATSSFNRKETVVGFLQPTAGISRVVAPRNGVVRAVYVSGGERVEQGQSLILLNTPEYLSDGESLSALMAGNLAEQTSILVERKTQLTQQAEFQKHELTQRIAFYDSQQVDLQEQERLAHERLSINELRLIDLQSLGERGLLAIEDIRQQQELVLNIRQQLAELRVTQQSHRAQTEQLSGELARLPSDIAQQISMVDAEISRLEHQQFELNARRETLITAPVAGVVTNLVVEVGHHVQPASFLVTIMPSHSELKVVLLVPTRAYGFVQKGQITRIRFDAFPYQRFGLFEGRVTRTSTSIVLPDEIAMPVAIQEPVYRAEATLTAQEIRAYGESMPLQAGMLLSADIVLEQRSLLAWLFEPLLSLKGRL